MDSTDDARLIDVLLGRAGVGERLLSEWHNLPNMVQCVDALDVTEVQREKLRAAFALRIMRESPAPSVMSPGDAYSHLSDMGTLTSEHLDVLVLDTRNQIMHRENIYRGSVNTTQLRIAEVLRPAVIRKAAGIVIAHNHPSGDPSPSTEDVAVTKMIVEAGQLMDIKIVDHIIVGSGRFVSLKERGLGNL